MVRQDDQHGRFWMEEEHMWSDAIQTGHKFTTEREADLAAARARVSAIKAERFPTIKVVGFK
jgi:hypothetical protein